MGDGVGVQTDLATWLGQCIDEDEQQARACAVDVGYGAELNWRVGGEESIYVDDTNVPVAVGPWGGGINGAQAAHIAAWDPARVLAECDTKRRIIEQHAPHHRIDWGCVTCSDVRYPCETLRLLALPMAGREGYRQDLWAPDGR